MIFLKQSTGVTVLIGPFVKRHTGGSEPYKTYASASAVSIVKTASSLKMQLRSCTDAISHVSRGFYNCQLNATDTNTAGWLQLCSATSYCLPIWHQYTVVPQKIYDTFLGADTFTGTSIASIKGSVERTGTSVTEILVDTSTTLQGELDGIEATVERSGTSITDLQARHSRTGISLTASGISLNSSMYTRIQTGVSSQLTTSRSEPAAGAPAATTNPLVKIDYLYKAWRNKTDSGATSILIYMDDGSTPAHKITHSDSGTTYTKGEVGAV